MIFQLFLFLKICERLIFFKFLLYYRNGNDTVLEFTLLYILKILTESLYLWVNLEFLFHNRSILVVFVLLGT